MEIKVLGPGCANCQTLDKLVRETDKEMRIEANIEHLQDLVKILDYNIISTPALVINEEVKSTGRVPNKAEIKQMINKAIAGGSKS